jgi:hypothetical protein
MTDDEILQRLRQAFRTGLPRELPTQPGAMDAGGGRGHSCSACGDMIGPHDRAPMVYRYPDQVVRFHGRCDDLWHGERHRLTPRT